MADFQMIRVTFKTQLHCQGCMKKMENSLSKIKGVQGVSMDKSKDLVFVTGFNLVPSEIQGFMRKKHTKEMQIVRLEYGGFFGPPRADTPGGGIQAEVTWRCRNELGDFRYERSGVCSYLEWLLFMIVLFVVSWVLVSQVGK